MPVASKYTLYLPEALTSYKLSQDGKPHLGRIVPKGHANASAREMIKNAGPTVSTEVVEITNEPFEWLRFVKDSCIHNLETVMLIDPSGNTSEMTYTAFFSVIKDHGMHDGGIINGPWQYVRENGVTFPVQVGSPVHAEAIANLDAMRSLKLTIVPKKSLVPGTAYSSPSGYDDYYYLGTTIQRCDSRKVYAFMSARYLDDLFTGSTKLSVYTRHRFKFVLNPRYELNTDYPPVELDLMPLKDLLAYKPSYNLGSPPPFKHLNGQYDLGMLFTV